MQTKGTVTAISGAYADVEVRRRVMCDGCPNDPNNPDSCGHACAMGSLLGDRKNMTVRVKNLKNAGIGDTVILESSDRTVLLSAFLFFILPLIFASIGFWLGGVIGDVFGGSNGDAIAGMLGGGDAPRWIGAIFAFVLAYVLASLAERRARKSDALIVMKEVAPHPDKSVSN